MNDWQNIISYLGMGFALTTIYVIFQYNVYASIIVHMSINIFAFITIFTGFPI